MKGECNQSSYQTVIWSVFNVAFVSPCQSRRSGVRVSLPYQVPVRRVWARHHDIISDVSSPLAIVSHLVSRKAGQTNKGFLGIPDMQDKRQQQWLIYTKVCVFRVCLSI